MRDVPLIRYEDSDQGTRGTLVAGGEVWHTLELPWRDNRQNVSRIPAGEYELGWIEFGSRIGGIKFGYWLHPVEGRSGILIHPGNLAGDREDGMTAHSYGCILLGTTTGVWQDQWAVFHSRRAVRQFHEELQQEPARLIIEEVGDVG